MTGPEKEATYSGTAASGATDEFLDLAGHELRSPITALKGHVQLLQRRLRRQAGRETDLADLDKVMFQVERLTHELDVYLETVHIERGRFELMPVSCDLVAITERLVELYARGVVSHGIRLETAERELAGQWDRPRLQTTVASLLSNAVKFSRGGDVVVRLTRAGAFAHFEISDRGIGVPPADRRHIFAAYARGSNAENAGAGLGLFVSREIVRRSKGRIGVRGHRGGGSVFWFTLPLDPAGYKSSSASAGSRRRPRNIGTSSRV
jgi:two-component system CheB/CheR fusion protein